MKEKQLNSKSLKGVVFAAVVLQAFMHLSALRGASVVAWGDNTYGQTNVPVDLTNAVAISSGADYCLALRNDGTLTAWGDNQLGQCNVPAGLGEVVAISACDDQSVALRADGTVVTWGAYGSDVPPNLGGVVAVARSLLVSLALKADGTVVAWPKSTQFGESDVPTDLTNAVAISAGLQCLALRSDGTVTVWGSSSYTNVDFPKSITNAVAVSAGWRHNLALLGNGQVIAWGDNTGGQCNVPVDLTNAVAISAGEDFSLALRADGTVVGWGFMYQVTPPSGLSNVTAVSAGLGRLAMAILNPSQGGVTIPFISPQKQTIGSGSQAFFSVAAAGAPPLSFQWYFFGTNAIPGATNRWLTIPNALPSQSGLYNVVVSNEQSSATSPFVALEVAPSLDISMVPAINLKGQTGATYRIDYLPQAGITNDWLPLATVTLTNNQQYYPDFSAIGQPARFYRLVQVP